MLALQYGKLIKDARVRRGLKQEDLAVKANVSRAVLSRLEQSKPKAVQSDTIDRLLDALQVFPQLDESGRDGMRKLARLEQELRVRELRERHLRLALELADDPREAAKERVALWRSNKSCSASYIERWSQLLSLPPRKMAKEIASLGEWQDALFQNSPWLWAWT
jgi:transcriptional regulator with XRE-family HTH domain